MNNQILKIPIIQFHPYSVAPTNVLLDALSASDPCSGIVLTPTPLKDRSLLGLHAQGSHRVTQLFQWMGSHCLIHCSHR